MSLHVLGAEIVQQYLVRNIWACAHLLLWWSCVGSEQTWSIRVYVASGYRLRYFGLLNRAAFYQIQCIFMNTIDMKCFNIFSGNNSGRWISDVIKKRLPLLFATVVQILKLWYMYKNISKIFECIWNMKGLHIINGIHDIYTRFIQMELLYNLKTRNWHMGQWCLSERWCWRIVPWDWLNAAP